MDAVVGVADDADAAGWFATTSSGSPRHTAEAPPALSAADAEALGRFDEPVRPMLRATLQGDQCCEFPYRYSDYGYRYSDYSYPLRFGPAQPTASFPA